MALLAEHGRAVPTTDSTSDADQEPAVDHLVDIHTVLRSEKRVRTQVVLARLTELNPAEYEDWTFQDLAAALAVSDRIPPHSHRIHGWLRSVTDQTHTLPARGLCRWGIVAHFAEAYAA
jgi:hypothetical protein